MTEHQGDDVGGSISPIPADVCLTLLMGATVGQIAFVGDDGRLQLIPVNFTVVDRQIFFRTRPDGVLAALADGRDNVALGVVHGDAAVEQGWNVTVRGATRRAEEPVTLQTTAASGLGDPWAGGDRPLLVELAIREIDGRRVSRA